MDLLQLAIEKWYTKKWLATEYNLLSWKWYHIHWQYDTKSEAKENLGRWMMYSRYDAIRNPNYKK
jgi:hypothetical protein